MRVVDSGILRASIDPGPRLLFFHRLECRRWEPVSGDIEGWHRCLARLRLSARSLSVVAIVGQPVGDP